MGWAEQLLALCVRTLPARLGDTVSSRLKLRVGGLDPEYDGDGEEQRDCEEAPGGRVEATTVEEHRCLEIGKDASLELRSFLSDM